VLGGGKISTLKIISLKMTSERSECLSLVNMKKMKLYTSGEETRNAREPKGKLWHGTSSR